MRTITRRAALWALALLVGPAVLFAQPYPSATIDFDGPTIGDRVRDQEMFRIPEHSGSTNPYIVANTTEDLEKNAAWRDAGIIAPISGNVAALTIAFDWVDATDPDAWLRLTTLDGPIHPNPSLDTRGKVRFIFTSTPVFNSPLGVCLGIRETGVVTGQMLNGGSSGPIEWFGVTTDLSVIEAGSNGILDSIVAGDDVLSTNGVEAISWGANRVLDSVASGDDVATTGYVRTVGGARAPAPAIVLDPNTSFGNLVEWDLTASTVRVSTNATPAGFGAPIAVGTAAFTGNGDLSDAPNNRGVLEHIAFTNDATDFAAEQFVAVDELQFEALDPDPVTPPSIVSPIREGDTTVTVTDLMPAVNQIQLFRNSTTTAERTVNVSNNNDLVINLTGPAVAGDVFRAKQRSGDSGEVSEFSQDVIATPLGLLLVETFDEYMTQEDLLAVWSNSIAAPSDQLTLERGDAVSCNNFVQEDNENSTTFNEARLYRGFGSGNGSDAEPLHVTWRFRQTAVTGNERTRFELARFASGTWSAGASAEGSVGFSISNSAANPYDRTGYNVILRTSDPEVAGTNGFVSDFGFQIAPSGVTKSANIWHKFEVVINSDYINWYIDDALVTPEAFTIAGGASTNGVPRPNADPYQFVTLGIGVSNNGSMFHWDDIAVSLGEQTLPFGDPPPAAPQIDGSLLPNDVVVNVVNVNSNATEIAVDQNGTEIASVTTSGFEQTSFGIATPPLANGSLVTVRQLVDGMWSCDSLPATVGAIPGTPDVEHPLEASDVFVTVSGIDASATLVSVYANSSGLIGSIDPEGAATIEVPVDPLVHLDMISATASNPIGESPQSEQLEVGRGNGDILLTLGIRETGGAGPVGANGGSSGTIEWLGASVTSNGAPQGKPISPSPNWQTVTFDRTIDPAVGFTGNGTVEGTWGVLESIAIAVDAGSPDRSVGSYQVYLDNFVSGTTVLADFDSQTPGSSYMFQPPGFSGSTSMDLLTPPNLAAVSGIGNPGYSMEAQFYYVDSSAQRWLRFTTFNAPVLPNPLIQLDQPLSFDILLLEQSLPDPPSVRSPLEAGDTTVTLDDVAADATQVDILADGVVIASVDPMGATNGFEVTVPPLEHLDLITARQTADGTSPVSSGLEVGKGNGVIYLSLGIRETGDAGPLGSTGGTSGSLEWIGATGRVTGGGPIGTQVVPMNAWQTVTFDPADVVAWIGNGVIDGTRGVIEHLAVTVDAVSPDRSTGVYRLYIDNVVNENADGMGDFLVSDFEGYDLDSEVMFQEPTFSGSTDFNLSFPPSASANTGLYDNGGDRSQLLTWFFRDTAETRWVRIVTSGTAHLSRPIIDITQPVRMDVLLLAGCANPGDVDGDCDIDIDDLALFTPCVEGPGAGSAPACVCADMNGDFDVDLVDFQLFQLAYGSVLPDCTP